MVAVALHRLLGLADRAVEADVGDAAVDEADGADRDDGLAVAAMTAGALGLMIGFGALVGLSMAGVTFARLKNNSNTEEPSMTAHDENFKDDSGMLAVVLGLAVLVGMSCLPATIGWYQLFAG